jgi:pre-mRNA-splicing helicase BRR2
LKELASAEAAAAQAANGDVDMSTAPVEVATIPKANLQPGSLVQPKGTVDLDSMMFGQGSRLMSNKKCRLPEGSFKRSKKGYEEIHIPAPEKAIEQPNEKMPLQEMPEWTRQALGEATHLNRMQTKVYPVAFWSGRPNASLCSDWCRKGKVLGLLAACKLYS